MLTDETRDCIAASAYSRSDNGVVHVAAREKPCGTSGKSMVSVVGERSFSVLYLRQQLNQSKVHHAREHKAARSSQSARVTIPVNVTVALIFFFP